MKVTGNKSGFTTAATFFDADGTEEIWTAAELLAGKESKALAGTGTILIVGPAGAKTELANHLAAHAPGLSTRVAGVETVDHSSEGELLALARQFFHASDRMHSVA